MFSMIRASMMILGALLFTAAAVADDSPGRSVRFAPQDESAQATVEALIQASAQGHPEALCSALPTSYRRDVNEVVRLFGTNMDPGVWNQILGVVERIRNIVDTKAKFIANAPALADRVDREKLEQGLPHVAQLLNTLVQATDLEKLQTFDLDEFASAEGRDFFRSVNALSELVPEDSGLTSLARARVETLAESSGQATVRITIPGQDEGKDHQLVRIEGRWVPAELAENWSKEVDRVKTDLAQLDQQTRQLAPQVTLFAGMINGALLPIESAESQEQFDSAVQQVVAGLAPLGL